MERNIPKHLTSRIPILYLCVVVKITITLTHTTQTHENKDYLAEDSAHRHHHPDGHRHYVGHHLVHGALMPAQAETTHRKHVNSKQQFCFRLLPQILPLFQRCITKQKARAMTPGLRYIG